MSPRNEPATKDTGDLLVLLGSKYLVEDCDLS